MDFATQNEAVIFAEHEVKQHHVGPRPRYFSERRLVIPGEHDFKALSGEIFLHDAAELRIVVYDEDAAHRLFGSCPLIRMFFGGGRESVALGAHKSKKRATQDPTAVDGRAAVMRCRLTHVRPRVTQDTEKGRVMRPILVRRARCHISEGALRAREGAGAVHTQKPYT